MAAGAAFAYYCLFTLFSRGLIGVYPLFLLIFISLAALCLFRVLAYAPSIDNAPLKEGSPSSDGAAPAGSSQKARSFRPISLRVTAFTIGLAIGIGAGAKAEHRTSFGIPESDIRGISGILLDDPRLISGDRAMTTLSLRMVMGASGVRATARGEITVLFPEYSTGRLKEFGRGIEVFAEGILRRGGTNGAYLFSAESLHVTKTAPPLERFRTGLRLGLTQRFTQSDSAEGASWGGLALALLVGIRDNLDTSLASLYRDAGCAHILALSGMHLALLVVLVSFLLKGPLGLKGATVFGAVIIVAYYFIVGPQPSLNRAILMYLLGVLAVLGMLKKDALSLLGMAFLLQLAVTPEAGFSVSFMLSYLALAGIIIIGASLNTVFKGTIPSFILSPISVSMGAFIATAGVSAWFFGVLRPVGIIAGLVIAPLITVFMLGSMAWLCLDFVLPSFSFLLSRPLSLLYVLMEKIVAIAGYVPGIRADLRLIITLSLLIAVLAVWFDRRRRIAASRMEPFL
jgi:competence protein ComEC